MSVKYVVDAFRVEAVLGEERVLKYCKSQLEPVENVELIQIGLCSET